MLERSSSGIYSRMLVFCFIATICGSRDFRKDQSLPEQPGQKGWLPSLEFRKPRTSCATDSFTMVMSWRKPGSFGMNLLPSSSGKMTSGSLNSGLEMAHCHSTAGSKLFRWGLTRSTPAFRTSTASRRHIACEQLWPSLFMESGTCSLFWYTRFWTPNRRLTSWNSPCTDCPQLAGVNTTGRSMPALEEVGTDLAISRTKAMTTFLQCWSRSGPESGGGTGKAWFSICTECESCFCLRFRGGPAEVRVRGTEGQQPLEAKYLSLQSSLLEANHFDQTYELRDLKEIYLQVGCSSVPISDNRSHSDRLCGPKPSPIPLSVLACTVTLMLAILTLSPTPIPKTTWQTTKIFKGMYRRRPTLLSTTHLTRTLVPSAPFARSATLRSGPRKCSGCVVFLLALAMLVHSASAAPTIYQGQSALQTPSAVGVTHLCSRKHSFQRAQRRALDTGFAVYRGRNMTAKQLGVEWKLNKPARPRKPTIASNHHRIRVITWNSGGLNLARQAEVRTWLAEEPPASQIHVLCIQETHWPTSCEYRDGPWTCIHSGSGNREGGVLVMLNTSFFSSTDIKHAEIIPGRMLHVRICSDPAIDLLCVYQHAWNPAKSEFQHRSVPAEQLLINKRQEVWSKMQGWIAGVPKRNLLGILGDFNASLYPQHPHVGFGVGHSHLHKKDGQALQSLIQTAGLNAVNTWGKSGQKASTFWTHRGEGSQIDFILVRNPCNLSRIRSATLPQAPIVHPHWF